MLTTIFAVFAGCLVLERLVPGWPLPRVRTWPLRVVAINAVQLGVVVLAGLTWERWCQGGRSSGCRDVAGRRAASPRTSSRRSSSTGGIAGATNRLAVAALPPDPPQPAGGSRSSRRSTSIRARWSSTRSSAAVLVYTRARIVASRPARSTRSARRWASSSITPTAARRAGWASCSSGRKCIASITSTAATGTTTATSLVGHAVRHLAESGTWEGTCGFAAGREERLIDMLPSATSIASRRAMNRRRFLGAPPRPGCSPGATSRCPTASSTRATRVPQHLRTHALVAAAWRGLDARKVWDVHCHVFGTGDSGSGIWLNPALESGSRCSTPSGCSSSMPAAPTTRPAGSTRATSSGCTTCEGMRAGSQAAAAPSTGPRETGTPIANARRSTCRTRTRPTSPRGIPHDFEWVASIHPYRRMRRRARRRGARRARDQVAAVGAGHGSGVAALRPLLRSAGQTSACR